MNADDDTVPRVRFSPTPSPRCSLGLARTAFLTNLLAESSGGVSFLTSDDLIAAEGYLIADSPLMEDLAWLGLSWSLTPWSTTPGSPLAQSGRTRIYAQGVGSLLSVGAAYRCACPPRVRPGLGKCPCRDRPALDGATVRFKMPAEGGPLYTDFASGIRRRAAPIPFDPVLVRADGTPTSWLTYPADDMAYGITLPIFDRGRAGIDAYVTISAALGHRIGLVVDLGRIVLTGDATRGNIRAFRSQGVSANEIRYALLASLFGSWPRWLPTDPASAAQWCDWSRLRSSVTTLDTNHLRPPDAASEVFSGDEYNATTAEPADPLIADVDNSLAVSPERWSAGHLVHCLRILATRSALLRRRAAAAPGGLRWLSERPDTDVHSRLIDAYRLLSAGDEPTELVDRLMRVTENLAFRKHLDLVQIDLLDFIRSCIIEPSLIEDARFSTHRGLLDSIADIFEIAVFVDGIARRPLAVRRTAAIDAVLAALVDRGDLGELPAKWDRVLLKPGRVISVDRRSYEVVGACES